MRPSTMAAAVLFFMAVLTIAPVSLKAQTFDLSRVPTVSAVPQEFVGTWEWSSPRQSCGSTRDSYGNIPLVADGSEETRRRLGSLNLCQWPIDQLEKVLNGRGRAWRTFTQNGADDAISPRWSCQAAGLGIVLTENYLRTFNKRPDALVMEMEQSNWSRYIWMDGRKHPPATEAYYHGHAIGWMEGKTLVVETTNFTWDPDGYDDHSHIARSHLATFMERYTMKDHNTMELAITVKDPLFLKEPFTYVGVLKRTDKTPTLSWDCDPEVGLKELYDTMKNLYPDDTTPAKYENQ